jgi:hypothetical protein
VSNLLPRFPMFSLLFTEADLHQKTVEYEVDNKSTAFGTLDAATTANGLKVNLHIDADAPKPVSMDLFFLRRHPFAARAHFLWAEHADELVAHLPANS